MMRYWLLFVFVVTATVAADEDPDVREILESERREQGKPIAVLYLVENLRISDTSERPEKRDGGVVLADPISDDENVPDGIYFRPINGKEVERGTVSKK